MKKYEVLVILNLMGKEESLDDVIKVLTTGITESGGKIENVQKMDKKHFARVTKKRIVSGFYLNIIFQSDPSKLAGIQKQLDSSDDVHRTLFTIALPTEQAA